MVPRRTRRDLPAGTVTFLFTDVEGSTSCCTSSAPSDTREALAEHRRVVRGAFAATPASRSIRRATPSSSRSRRRGGAPGGSAAIEALAVGPDPGADGHPTGTPHPHRRGLRRRGRPHGGAHRSRRPRRPGAALEGDTRLADGRGSRSSASTGSRTSPSRSRSSSSATSVSRRSRRSRTRTCPARPARSWAGSASCEAVALVAARERAWSP